jgi:beta-glucanase (GH16 family)
MRTKKTLVLFATGIAFCGSASDTAAETPNPEAYEWTEEFAGEPLNLDGYTLVFSDEFDEPSISDEGGPGPWLAPVHSDYGKATFDRPSRSPDTYVVRDGILTIRATQATNGKWHAGSIQTVDRNGKGIAQPYGYFEARMKFPPIPGAWCAFWLKSQAEHWDASMIRTEIDVVEWYGGDLTGHHRAVHLRPPRAAQSGTPDRLSKHWWTSNFSRHQGLADAWHVYGALITPDLVTIYLDGKELSRFPTLDEFKTPLYPLVSLSLHEKNVDDAVSPIEMQVDYVRIYTRQTTAPTRLAE